MGAEFKAERIANMRMSPAVPYLMYPPQLEGWVGGEKGFDPLMVTDALPVYWVREAELKHARVCMLATIGWIATDCGLRFPGEQFQVSTLQAHDAMVECGIFLPFPLLHRRRRTLQRLALGAGLDGRSQPRGWGF